MMHDFRVPLKDSIVLVFLLSLDLFSIARGRPIVEFNDKAKSRFGVFPRCRPDLVQWIESDACDIFHTANTWSDKDAVILLVCRFKTPKLVYAAGNIAQLPSSCDSEDVCELYYYRISIPKPGSTLSTSHEFALTSIPFERPSIPHATNMQDAQYIYVCTTRSGSFYAAHGAVAKLIALRESTSAHS